ncbi:MAG: NAD(+)/NADH kinase [Acidimicrobiia bacterium]|nr:NAD(+)/NADH kinase [Acidimicrobiia bacterium]
MGQISAGSAIDVGGRDRTGTVGLIANPVSARDIRRVIANASSLQVADRANIVLRAAAALGATGIDKIYAMPDKKGIQALVQRGLERERNMGHRLPHVEFLDMSITSSVDDTHRAVDLLAELAVDAIIVLGGDGTHRAVVSRCATIPIVGISTGTNNAYPEMRESTVSGLAAGLYSSGAVPGSVAITDNKLLEVSVNGGEITDLALVDVVASTDRYVGARALWRTESIAEIFVTFADPEAVGMSAVAGVLEPVGRADRYGLHVKLGPGGRRLKAAIGPGMLSSIDVESWTRLLPEQAMAVTPEAGTLALDGERELELRPGDDVSLTLRPAGFVSIDVGRTVRWAAREGIFIEP